MRIISESKGMKATEYNLQEIYDRLTSYYFVTNESVRNGKELSQIIAWLPLIDSILSGRLSLHNVYLDILFTNGSKIRMYNTFMEYAFDMLIDD